LQRWNDEFGSIINVPIDQIENLIYWFGKRCTWMYMMLVAVRQWFSNRENTNAIVTRINTNSKLERTYKL
jgi:hypothetical protein